MRLPEGAYRAHVHSRHGIIEGSVVFSDGMFHNLLPDGFPERPVGDVAVFEDVVNAHTHCADNGLRIPEGMTLEELVAPPDGLKHRYLREASPEILSDGMESFRRDSLAHGVRTFVDFRENGAEGCRILREAVPEAVILGRLESSEFDPEEFERIMRYADGIGISSISDIPVRLAEDIADAVRERRAFLGIHASERVREDMDAVLSLDPTFVVHMCEATAMDVTKCAEAEVPVAVCPGSNAYFGKEPPVVLLDECGADMMLGTDNAMLRPPDMAAEASLLMDVLNRRGGDPDCVVSALTCMGGKILNRPRGMGEPEAECRMAVPFEGEYSPENVFRSGATGHRIL